MVYLVQGFRGSSSWPAVSYTRISCHKCVVEQRCLVHHSQETEQRNNVRVQRVRGQIQHPRSSLHDTLRHTQSYILLIPQATSKPIKLNIKLNCHIYLLWLTNVIYCPQDVVINGGLFSKNSMIFIYMYTNICTTFFIHLFIKDVLIDSTLSCFV